MVKKSFKDELTNYDRMVCMVLYRVFIQTFIYIWNWVSVCIVHTSPNICLSHVCTPPNVYVSYIFVPQLKIFGSFSYSAEIFWLCLYPAKKKMDYVCTLQKIVGLCLYLITVYRLGMNIRIWIIVAVGTKKGQIYTYIVLPRSYNFKGR